MAVEETGPGVYEAKVIKNMFATEYTWHDIKNEKTVRILDENGTPAPYAQFPVQFTVEGSAALVGPQTAVAEGGMTGTYLRTVGTAGEALVTVSAPPTQPVVLQFTIEKEDAVWN